MPGVLYVVYV